MVWTWWCMCGCAVCYPGAWPGNTFRVLTASGPRIVSFPKRTHDGEPPAKGAKGDR